MKDLKVVMNWNCHDEIYLHLYNFSGLWNLFSRSPWEIDFGVVSAGNVFRKCKRNCNILKVILKKGFCPLKNANCSISNRISSEFPRKCTLLSLAQASPLAKWEGPISPHRQVFFNILNLKDIENTGNELTALTEGKCFCWLALAVFEQTELSGWKTRLK